jgi:Family of unknown function (DUF6174)
MRSMTRMIATLGALTLAAGCRDSLSEPTASQLAAARAVWATNGYTSYQFTITMDCFCGVNGPIRATVVDDSLVSATLVASGESINPQWVSTVKDLFDFIDRGLTNHADVLRVTYDPNLGYPRQIVYDGSRAAADDEITYTVSDVASASSLSARR